MREIAALTFISLDGVIQGPTSPDEDPSGGFTQGGWVTEYMDDVMPQVITEAMTEPYDILFGRKTYDLFASHWPSQGNENPVSNILNNARKFVVTTSPKNEYDWQHTIPISGDIITEVSRLKQEDGPLLQIHGSCNLIQTLGTHNLIDEYRLWTFPVLLGNGRRLFRENTVPTKLKLKKAKHTSSGVVMGIYRLDL